ncbi:hypothetical protein ACOSQ2_006113 [Xanthoceras sorbifolium]
MIKIQTPDAGAMGKDISKGNVCVATDALHPMTSDAGTRWMCSFGRWHCFSECIAEALNKRNQAEELKTVKMKTWKNLKSIEMGLKKEACQREEMEKLLSHQHSLFWLVLYNKWKGR